MALSMRGLRLEPADEHTHVPDASPSFSESVYANAFDPTSRVGGWMRLGNRYNERIAEVSVCLYLPDGRVACRFGKPAIASYERLSAGGLVYEVDAPFERVTMEYAGPVFVLDDPDLLRRPKEAFVEGRRAPCSVRWVQTSLSPPHGGEPVSADQATAYGRDFSLGHFNLHTKVDGEIAIGGERFAFDGLGWRDHSWGPRDWQTLHAHRLLTACFDVGLGVMIHKIEDRDGAVRRLGTLLVDGRYEEVTDLDMAIRWNERREPIGADVRFRTAARRGALSARVMALAPLRSRRQAGDVVLESRILEASAELELDGRVGYGMFELIDAMTAGQPAGFPL
jgi:hypothetical protein